MKLEGIVLSEIDYKEASKIVNLYTEKGKIGVKALGSKKIKNGLLGFITTGNTVSIRNLLKKNQHIFRKKREQNLLIYILSYLVSKNKKAGRKPSLWFLKN